MQVRLMSDHITSDDGIVPKGTEMTDPPWLTMDMAPLDDEANTALNELWQAARGCNNLYAMAPPTLLPVNVDVPYVSPEVAAVGDTLSCTMGNWEGQPTTYGYVWSTGGTGQTYVIVEGDAGKSISCVVTATNAGGSTAARPSNAVSIPGGATRAASGKK